MESSILGVPHMGRSDSNVSGIRAPITLDESDFEYSGSSYYSGSELEGFESGEDISEKARIFNEDDGFVEETDIVNELAVSDGAVVELNGEVVEGSSNNERKFVQETGNVVGNGVFRPLARFPDGETHKGVGNSDGSDGSGSLLSDSSDDELVEEVKEKANLVSSRPVVAVVNDEISEGELSPVLSFKVPSARKLAIPVAKISGDSDDDSCDSVVLDDEGFSGVARVPSIEMLDRINSVPKVRILEADEEGDENESQAENVVKMELVENLLVNGMALSPLDEKGTIVVETLANSTLESGHNEDLIHLHEDIKEVDVVEDMKECVELVDFREPADIVENESIVLPNISCVSSVGEAEVSDFGGSLDDKDGKNNNSGLEDNCIFNHDYGSENVESMKQEIEQTVESLSFDDDHEISSAHLCVDINEVPAEAVPVYINDSISEDASSTCAFAAGHTVFEGSKLEQEPGKEAEASDPLPGEIEESSFHSNSEAMIVEMGVVQDSTTPHAGGISLDYMQEIDGQVVEDIHDEVDVDGEMSNGRHTIDPAAVAALFKAVRSAASEADDIKFVSVDGVNNLSLGSNLNDLGIFDPARATSAGGGTHDVRPSSINVELGEALSESEKENIKKIQKIRVRYLCLLEKLGRSPEDSVASKVLHQLTLAAGSSHSLEFHLDSIRNAALELEAQRRDNSDFSLSVLIIGKTGVGKSATINSILGEGTAVVDAFEPSTARVKEVTGLINGVKIKIFDTPGLRTSLIDQSINRKILSSIKKVMKRSPPDVILYVDRLDTQRDNLNDLPLLRLVTSFLGSSIWKKSIVAFTHGTSVPPDGPNGFPLSYEAFVAKQLQVIQELICHSTGEPVVMSSGLMIPVCVIENHSFAEKNGSRETVLHDGERWISQLLLLCCSMKILSEVSSVVATRSSSDYEEVFGLQIRPPPLSDYLSSFLKSYVHPELSNDQSGDIVGSDVEVVYSSDSNQEKNIEKQSSEEMRRIRSLSRSEVAEQETEAPESVAVPLPDMALPPSFDGDIPSFRYRVLEHSSCLLTRPILVSPWDHDCNYGGLLIEDKIIIANCFPALISVQLTKDKKEFDIQLHSSVSAKHGDKGSTMAGLDILRLGEKLSYTLKGEARIKDFRKHRTAAAAFITFVEENVVSGLKVEDHVPLGKRAALVGNAGIIQSQDDAAYGVNLDLCVKGKDHPINEDETSVGMSVIRSRGGLICGCNLHSRISMSRNSKVDITAALNNGLKGRISIKTSSSDQLQIAALALVPTAIAVVKRIFRQSSEG